MDRSYDYFIVFAEMRTGSNFLETNINAFNGLSCHGEAFNPHFIGYPNAEEILGVGQAERDADPAHLIATIRDKADGIGGFRYFHDHDPRVMDLCMDDPRCAKIVLTRNPVDSYVSWKIAQATGQWKLGDAKARKDAQAEFVADEFTAHLQALQDFQVTLLRRLQTSGQTAFYIAYEDLQSVEVMNGLAGFLGVSEKLEELDKTLKKQNPSPLFEKVSNFEEMQLALSGLDQFNLTRTPNFEPRRGPAIPTYVAGAVAPLLFMPMKCGPEDQVQGWLADLDSVGRGKLMRRITHKDLRQWKRQNHPHRSFTVLRHPMLRAHHAFCHHILNTGKGSFVQLRKTLIRRYKLPLPQVVDGNWTKEQHREAFAAFLRFLKGNIAGQTAIRIDSAWCSQAQLLMGYSEFGSPDVVLREDEMAIDLPALAAKVGYDRSPELRSRAPDVPYDLSDIYDSEIEALTREVYHRDYVMFGFGAWA